MSRWAALLPPLLAPLGGALVWIAERVWPGTAASPYLAGAGAALLLAALALNLPPFLEERGGNGLRTVAGWLAAPYVLFVLALVLHYVGRSQALTSTGPVDWHAIVTGAWMLALTAGAVLFVFLTLARLAQLRAPQRDARRIRGAGSAGLSLALLVMLVALLNVVFSWLPWHWNLAYFKMTQPSAATREVAEGLTEPVQVGLFFTEDSAVGSLVGDYLQTLQRAMGKANRLKVQRADADLQPMLAQQFQARGNGWVVLRKGDVRRSIRLANSMDRARIQLTVFDRTFFRDLLEISRPRSIVYFTTGHGERTDEAAGSDPTGAFERFRGLLLNRNYEVKPLGIAQGLGDRVPADAALVVSAAPTQPFLPSEAAALRHYLAGGGRLLAFLDPRSAHAPRKSLPGVTLAALLQGYGVDFDPTVQANDHIYARRTYTKADRALLVTVGYQNHPSVALLRRHAGQFPLLLLNTGALSIGKVPPSLVARVTIRAMNGTWGDLNGNFEFDPPRERRGEPALAVAVAPRYPAARPAVNGAPTAAKGPHIVIFADADLAGDLLLQNRANAEAIDGALGWLVPHAAPPSLPETERDVLIRHAKGDDWLWFYLPVLGVPALLLGFGFFRATRRRPGRRHA